jgi:hypothetical protein
VTEIAGDRRWRIESVLVREGFVREFANGKAVVSYETMRRYLIPL